MFNELISSDFPQCENLTLNTQEIYEKITCAVINSLTTAGAFVPRKSNRSPVKPTWWSPECDDAINQKKKARKSYVLNPSNENLELYIQIEKESEKILSAQKKSFRELCNSISPSMGSKRIWGLISAFSGKYSKAGINTNNPNSAELKTLQDEIVREDIPPIPHTNEVQIDESNCYNAPFTRTEFFSALSEYKKDSAPGLDKISYTVIKKLPLPCLESIFQFYNKCFIESSFPDTWRSTLVRFIPKPSGKGFRPISLTSALGKLMERIVHARLEHFVDSRGLIPDHQFGFRRERSALDCVSVLAMDINKNFSHGKSTAVVALDIKGAFNALLPSAVLQQLRDDEVPGRLLNFISFMITNRSLHFGDDLVPPRICGVGVPQGGFYPLFFLI